ncbi:minor capsid protein [uncultured Finegoldia sp.]|uniref:minor capsid protein n=2 Tax=Finegoldia TaxID=150022 RepID=UPI0020699CD6|nr:minor capsid protein [uncultured Finegoldia sp.]DAM88878.1 MAG TPA: minor capsid protein [Caudoviricetes sp.]
MKNLNQYNEYSSKRQKELWDNLEKDEAKLIEKLTQFYREESHKLGKEIAEYFARYGKDNVIEYRSLLTRLSSVDRKLLYERFDDFIEKYPQYKHLTDVRKSIYKLTRLEGLNESIKLQQLEIGAKEVDRLYDYLVDLYGDTYYKMADSMGFGRTMLSFDKESAELLINKKWTQQKDYSDRIWENKSKLISYLTNDFKTSIIRGDSFNRVVKQMSERLVNRSKADIKRIVRTEGTRINNEAMMKTFDDSKLYDEYEYVAVIDRKTSDVCKDLDGEIFKLKDREVGINFPPMHVNCRSSFSVVIPDDYVDRYEKLYGDYFDENNKVGSGYNDKIYPISKQTIDKVSSPYIDSLSKEENSKITELHKSLLEFARDKNESMEVAYKMNSLFEKPDIILGTKTDLNLGHNETKFVFHNHPNNEFFSDKDILYFLSSENIKFISIIKHDGSINILEKTGDFDLKKSVIEFKRSEQKYKDKFAKDTQKRYNLIVEHFLKKEVKTGIKLY